eukprot:XP_011665911.1 PREDICTED: putative GPI-anchored protein PB15E9.01c [Strongylocentrotus purpuratus]
MSASGVQWEIADNELWYSGLMLFGPCCLIRSQNGQETGFLVLEIQDGGSIEVPASEEQSISDSLPGYLVVQGQSSLLPETVFENVNGTLVVIEPYVAVEFSLINDTYEEVKGLENVTFRVPVKEDSPLSKGDVLPAFYFDENTGHWMQNGDWMVIAGDDSSTLLLELTAPRIDSWVLAEAIEVVTATTVSGTEATPTNGTEATPTNGTEATPTNGAEATPTNGTEATPTNGAEATPTNGTEATPTNATVATPTNATVATPTNATTSTPVIVTDSVSTTPPPPPPPTGNATTVATTPSTVIITTPTPVNGTDSTTVNATESTPLNATDSTPVNATTTTASTDITTDNNVTDSIATSTDPLPSTETLEIKADLTVAVFSSSGSPLVNTTILVYNNNQTTFLRTSPDSNVVQISETILQEEWLGVVATKQGYATNGFVWQSGDATNRSLELIEWTNVEQLPGTLIDGIFRISFEAKNGATVSFIPDLGQNPGSLGYATSDGPASYLPQGVTEDGYGDIVPIDPLAAMDFALLQRGAREEIDLQDVVFTLPISSDSEFREGDNITAYLYNEETGLWIEDGQGEVILDDGSNLFWRYTAEMPSSWLMAATTPPPSTSTASATTDGTEATPTNGTEATPTNATVATPTNATVATATNATTSTPVNVTDSVSTTPPPPPPPTGNATTVATTPSTVIITTPTPVNGTDSTTVNATESTPLNATDSTPVNATTTTASTDFPTDNNVTDSIATSTDPLPATETLEIQAALTVAVFSSSGSPVVDTTILVYNNNQTTFLSTAPDSNVVQIDETILREEWLGVVATKQGYATNGFVWQSGDATNRSLELIEWTNYDDISISDNDAIVKVLFAAENGATVGFSANVLPVPQSVGYATSDGPASYLPQGLTEDGYGDIVPIDPLAAMDLALLQIGGSEEIDLQNVVFTLPISSDSGFSKGDNITAYQYDEETGRAASVAIKVLNRVWRFKGVRIRGMRLYQWAVHQAVESVAAFNQVLNQWRFMVLNQWHS